ncbi:MAG TPA: nucleotidyltransferase family protein [Candidatus Binatus sp.]|uniref:nucleotidyltransferase domain-containing protein n=1 Tax=Candidatus Binatus sp. TaxID=2811406 RepID=UPI002B464859|nr:nucleotidyltransferase family protein [Candidatus Binatus sp.]HKN14058.1 nucleotidyltransferase family protein [Candidatus Binatus sp.]
MVALRAPLELIVGNSVALNALLDHSKSSSEAALVLCCATLATPARSALASEIVARVHSWDSVAEIAKRHAVLPLVYRYLNLECQTSVPEEGLAKLRTQWQFVILYNRHLTAELVRLMGLLHVAGIAAVTFKGPVLAAMAYGSIELRQFVDLDILVRQSDLPRVAEILTAERYLSPHTRREGLATGYFQEYEDALFRPDGMGAVDVHWKVTPRSFRFGPDEETFWHRAHQIDLEFGTVNAIAPEDLLLYICVHAAKHGWVQLESICDVAETIRARPGIDLMAILDEATTLGSRRMFLTGIYLAHELVGAPVPSDLVAIARNDRAVRALARKVANQLFSGGAQGRANFDPWAVPSRSIEGARARIRYIVRRVFAPTMGDYEFIPLPTALFPLYWVIRPFRMAAQYGPRLLRRSANSSNV